jgi:hypothetical protein
LEASTPEGSMCNEKRLDALIEAGWHVIDTEYDKRALYFWKKKAYDFLENFVGPDHVSTQGFRNYILSLEDAGLI